MARTARNEQTVNTRLQPAREVRPHNCPHGTYVSSSTPGIARPPHLFPAQSSPVLPPGQALGKGGQRSITSRYVRGYMHVLTVMEGQAELAQGSCGVVIVSVHPRGHGPHPATVQQQAAHIRPQLRLHGRQAQSASLHGLHQHARSQRGRVHLQQRSTSSYSAGPSCRKPQWLQAGSLTRGLHSDAASPQKDQKQTDETPATSYKEPQTY